MIFTEPAVGTSMALGAGSVMTNVDASGALTFQRWPLVISRSCTDGWTLSSYATSKLKSTSAEVMA